MTPAMILPFYLVAHFFVGMVVVGLIARYVSFQKHGGLLFFRLGRFGGSFYISKAETNRGNKQKGGTTA